MHGRVDRGAFRTLTLHAVAGVDLRQPQAAAEHGLDVALLFRLYTGAVHVIFHAGIAREITLYVSGGRAAFHAQLFGQTERGHPVDQAEVDDLGVAALLAGHLLGRGHKNFRSRRSMDVLVIGEGLEQARIARQVRHDAQLDLRIVGGHDVIARPGDEGLAYAPPLGGAHRDVLQVRIVGCQTPGDRNGL